MPVCLAGPGWWKKKQRGRDRGGGWSVESPEQSERQRQIPRQELRELQDEPLSFARNAHAHTRDGDGTGEEVGRKQWIRRAKFVGAKGDG